MRLLAGALLLALAGCAGNPGSKDANPETSAMTGSARRAQVHTDLAANYYLRGQYAVALDELREAVKSDAGHAPAYNMLGLVHSELREDQVAEQHFRRAIDLSPNYSEAQNNFGMFLCLHKRLKEGMRHLETALGNPLYASPEKAQSNAGACALELGDVAAAEMYFVRANKRAPGHTPALLGLAETHFRQDRWLPARALLRQLSERGDLSAQALWLGVRVERKLGDRDAEAGYGAQLRRRFPDSMPTQWLITGQYEQMGSLL